ncbi:MAG: acyl-CoA thioesterase [Thermoprotei archaeon]|jgi:acyl-CoA hydrolase
MVSIKETEVVVTQYVFPEYANPLGNLYGGRMMYWITMAGTLAASKAARGFAVLASMDSIYFLNPVKVGHTVIITGRVEYIGKSSMEVSVDVDIEDHIKGIRMPATRAYMAFVAVDPDGNPRPVPVSLEPSDDEREIYERAIARRNARIPRILNRKEQALNISNIGDLTWKLKSIRTVMPEDALQGNLMFVGKLFMYIDEIAGILATKFAKGIVVTGSLDNMEFYSPIRIGDVLTLEAGITCIWNTSMEIKVKIITESIIHNYIRHVGTAYMVFVHLNEHGNPSPLPKYQPQTEDEKRACEDATKRRIKRITDLENIKKQLKHNIIY